MKLREAFLFPPNYRAIVRAFPQIRGQKIIFAWGDRIYNPGRITIGPELLAHEAAHAERQRDMGVEAWWDRYLAEPAWRLNEEVIGHRAEFLAAAAHMNRRNAERTLVAIAERLAGPLYGHAVDLSTAERLILEGPRHEPDLDAHPEEARLLLDR